MSSAKLHWQELPAVEEVVALGGTNEFFFSVVLDKAVFRVLFYPCYSRIIDRGVEQSGSSSGP